MAKQFTELSDAHIQFIAEQKIFFVGTATENSHINVSPKGMASFVVLSPSRIAWLNVTGSGNETAAHVQHSPRMTIMFCSFEGNPVILRLYGSAKAVHQGDPEWGHLISKFKPLPGSRQIFDVSLDLVQTSCGMSIPLYEYVGERELLNDWAKAKGDQGIREYWASKNQLSIDGIATNVIAKSG
jgi:hypothetical protein